MHHNPHPPRSRLPISLIVGLVVILLIPIGGCMVWLYKEWQVLDGYAPFLSGAIRLASFLLPASFLSWATATAIVIAWRRWGWKESIFADKTAALADKQRALPRGVQSVSWHDSHKALPALPLQLEAPAPVEPPAVPTFAQLLDQGLIGPGRPLILGYSAATGQAIQGGWKDLYSCGVGALQGAGKSWLLAFLLAQSAAQEGRLIVCDLHAGDKESLATRLSGLQRSFMRDVADTPKSILSAFEMANAKLEARRTNTARWPIVLVCDEWTSLLRTPAGTKLEPLIQNIAEQGRKFNVNGLLSAQAWTKDASGAVRNQLTSHYVLRQRPDEARYQLGMRAAQLPSDIRELPDACGYFLNVRGEMTKIIVPRMTDDDIVRVAALIDRPANAAGVPFGFPPTERIAVTAEINGKSTGNQNQNLISTAPLSPKRASPEAERVARLFVDGKDVPEIIRELRGDVKGRAYQAASAEIHALLREGMGQ